MRMIRGSTSGSWLSLLSARFGSVESARTSPPTGLPRGGDHVSPAVPRRASPGRRPRRAKGRSTSGPPSGVACRGGLGPVQSDSWRSAKNQGRGGSIWYP